MFFAGGLLDDYESIYPARSTLRAVQRRGGRARRRTAGSGAAGGIDHSRSGRDRLAHSATQPHERQPGDGRRLRPGQDRRRHARRRPDQQPAAGVRRLRRQSLERRDRRGDRQSAQSRLAAHAGAGQQPPPDARRSDAERRGLARPEPDSRGADRARRSADRRRIGRVRRRRRRRRRQLHHERQVRRRARRRAVQPVSAQQRRRHDPQHRARQRLRGCRTTTCATATPRTSRSSPASTRRTAAATPPSTSAIALSMRSRRTGATSAPARSPPPTPAIRRPKRSAAAARARRRRRSSRPTTRRSVRLRADRRIHGRRRRPDPRLRCVDRPVQLRAVELLPASGRAQDGRTVRALRLQRQGERLHRVHVHGRSHHRADRAERRVPRQRSRPAAVLRPLRGELRQPAAHDLCSRCVLRRQHRRGRRAARHRPSQRRRRRSHRRPAAHLVPRRRRPARRHQRRLELRRVRPVRHVDPVRELPERLLALAAAQCAERRGGSRTARRSAASMRMPTCRTTIRTACPMRSSASAA